MVDFFVKFIQSNPELVLASVTSLLALWGVSFARRSFTTYRENRFYDNLEADSLYQIEENLKEIQKVLEEPIEGGDGNGLATTLYKLMGHSGNIQNKEGLNKALAGLSPPFAKFCANLDKYNSNIMKRKEVCMKFQEYGNKARAYFTLFERAGYDDIPLSFAKLHLNQANISY